MYPLRIPRSVVTRRKTAKTTQRYVILWIISGSTVHKVRFSKAPNKRSEGSSCRFENHTEAKNWSNVLAVLTAVLLRRATVHTFRRIVVPSSSGSSSPTLLRHVPEDLNFHYLMLVHGPGSSVGIATDYGLDGPGSNPGGDEIFRPSRPGLWPTQPPVQWVPGLSQG